MPIEPHDNDSFEEPPHSETDSPVIRTTDRVAALQHGSVDPNSMLGRWLINIRDPIRCPTTLQGGMHLKGSPSYAIDAFIDSLHHNTLPRVLRLQNVNISNTQIRTLFARLPTTNIYAINIGEVDLDDVSRQLLRYIIPQTHLIQIFLKDLRDPALRTQLLHLLELNRQKVSEFHSNIAEPLPDHVETMWKRLRTTDPVSTSTRKRSPTSEDNHSQDGRSQPPTKKRQTTTVPSDETFATHAIPKPRKKMTTKHRNEGGTTSVTSSSHTQRLMDNYLVPNTITTLDTTHPESTTQGTKRPDIESSTAADKASSGRRRSKPAKRTHGAARAGARPGVEATGDPGGAAAGTSHSSCHDVTCTCPNVSVVNDSDDFSATIKSPANFFCALASPSSTKSTGSPQCSRNTKRSKHRGNHSLGGSSKLVQSATDHVASSSTPSMSSNPPASVPLSLSLEYDKGIAFS